MVLRLSGLLVDDTEDFPQGPTRTVLASGQDLRHRVHQRLRVPKIENSDDGASRPPEKS